MSKEQQSVVYRRFNNKSTYGFTGYSINGKSQFVKNGEDELGRPIKKKFRWISGEIDLKFFPSQQEEITFFDRHPENKANGGTLFFKYDEEALLKEENEKMQLGTKAVNEANALSGEPLHWVASVYGYLGRNEAKLKNTVLVAARNNAEAFLKTIHSPELSARALFLKAEANDVIRQEGVSYAFGSVLMGTEEEAVIAYLIAHDDVMQAVRRALQVSAQESPTEAASEAPVKKGLFGRPLKPETP